MWLKTFFYLQKNDRRGAVVLLLLALIAITLIFGVGNSETGSTRGNSLTDSVSSGGLSSSPRYYQVAGKRAELFPFDPNSADSTQLLRLGLRPWQVRNIYKYRAAGGVYRQPRDFARLYGLTRKQFIEMEPYIRISKDYSPASELYSSGPNYYDNNDGRGHMRDTLSRKQFHSFKLRPGQHVSLNMADTTELMKVPGIGQAYANAIVNYRNRLGGFANVSQLLDIGGLPQSALPFFSVSMEHVRKMNVNKLSLNQLRRHPYINFYQARDICDFRRTHGPIRNIEQLRGNNDFSAEEISKIAPYLEY